MNTDKRQQMLAPLVELKEGLELDDPDLGGTNDMHRALRDRGYDLDTIDTAFDTIEAMVDVYLGDKTDEVG